MGGPVRAAEVCGLCPHRDGRPLPRRPHARRDRGRLPRAAREAHGARRRGLRADRCGGRRQRGHPGRLPRVPVLQPVRRAAPAGGGGRGRPGRDRPAVGERVVLALRPQLRAGPHPPVGRALAAAEVVPRPGPDLLDRRRPREQGRLVPAAHRAHRRQRARGCPRVLRRGLSARGTVPVRRRRDLQGPAPGAGRPGPGGASLRPGRGGQGATERPAAAGRVQGRAGPQAGRVVALAGLGRHRRPHPRRPGPRAPDHPLGSVRLEGRRQRPAQQPDRAGGVRQRGGGVVHAAVQLVPVHAPRAGRRHEGLDRRRAARARRLAPGGRPRHRQGA